MVLKFMHIVLIMVYAFLNDLKESGQVINFSGVGAHHHNGVAE